MAEQAVRSSSESVDPQPGGNRWRTVDIVVTAVLGVAFGVVFWAWNLLWAATGTAFTAFPPAQAVMYGVWLLPAVLAPLIIRKPGAALFAEMVAAGVSALIGSEPLNATRKLDKSRLRRSASRNLRAHTSYAKLGAADKVPRWRWMAHNQRLGRAKKASGDISASGNP